MNFSRTLGEGLLFFYKVIRKINKILLKSHFEDVGRNFEFSPTDSIFSYKNIRCGNNVQIGHNAVFIATLSKIAIGNNVLFAPGVTIIGGTHNISVIGKTIFDTREKRPEDDLGVIIEDDVWIGTNTTILHGVRIKRGSVIGAGSIVTKSTNPYSISVGNPARIVRYRFSKEQILKHEELIYPQDRRLTSKEIDKFLFF